MSQKGEKYARRMERRVDKLEQDVAAITTEQTAQGVRISAMEDDLAVYKAAVSARELKQAAEEVKAAKKRREARAAERERRIHKQNMILAFIAIAGHAHKMKVIERVTDKKQMPVYEVRGGRITIKGKEYPIKLADGFYIIRKLTVMECKRLQTVPDTYAFPVSDTQAYKMLGNGWTVDVIAHIMSHFTGLTEEPVEVLSMYDGMSCGHIALDKLGAAITAYYATEIDKYAIQTTQHNFPDTVQLGDAFQVRAEDWRLPEPAGMEAEK